MQDSIPNVYQGYNPTSWYPGYVDPWLLTSIAAANQRGDGSEEETGTKKGIIELRMPFCCDGCAHQVQKVLKALIGVGSVECYVLSQKVVVTGDLKPEVVLKKAQSIIKRTEFWTAKQ
ncbi:hypothetical protein Mapa_006482 [Marchantia paleacea]|nr:hypothetical protein Mapa_006482 [Marchantia paleacea]